MGPEAVCAFCTDAAGTHGWGAPLGDSYIQGTWPKVALREGINWKELWVLKEALSHWQSCVGRKLVLVRMDSAAAVAYANHGAGRSRRRVERTVGLGGSPQFLAVLRETETGARQNGQRRCSRIR